MRVECHAIEIPFLECVKRHHGPVEYVNVGSFRVPVYATPSLKGRHEYPGFTALYKDGDGPHRIFRSSLDDLRAEVKMRVTPLAIGKADCLVLRGGERAVYERAKQEAAAMGLDADQAVLRLKEVVIRAERAGCTLQEALDYYTHHHNQSKFSTPNRQVVEAFLVDRKLMGNSPEDIATLRCRLHRFATEFPCPLRDITKDQYRRYFATTGISLRDRFNHRSSVCRLVTWARNNDYLPIDHPGIPRTGTRVRIPSKRVEVFNREQRELLIAQTRPVELPLTLLRAYVPIRSKECALVSWEDINWKTARLTVYADGAKKRELRSVSLIPELLARLEPHRNSVGRIYPFNSFYKVGPRLARKAGIRWIRNGWRCSVISHLQAFVRELGRVADEAGNSPTQIKQHYLKEIDPEMGRAWFGLSSGQYHPLEPVRQLITDCQQAVVGITPGSLPENVIRFASASSHS
jgi:integrase